MRRVVPILLAVQLLASAATAAEGKGGTAPEATGAIFPEGFTGRETAAMKLLFPGWAPSTEEVVTPDGGMPQRVHLLAARRWVADGRTFLAVLIEVDDPCTGASCGSGTVQLAVLNLQGTTLAVAVPPLEIGHHGAEAQTDLGPDLLPMSPEAALLPVLETTPSGRLLRLWALIDREPHVVFERKIADAAPVLHTGKAGCEAAIAVDEFGTFPYPLKVKEHCSSTGKTATEVWRWEGTRYLLHGPASDAAVGDQGLSSPFDEE